MKSLLPVILLFAFLVSPALAATAPFYSANPANRMVIVQSDEGHMPAESNAPPKKPHPRHVSTHR